jgi:hypothetical protein
MGGVRQYIAQRRTLNIQPVVPSDIYGAQQAQQSALASSEAYVMDMLIWTRAPKSVILAVNTTPTLIITPPNYWPYLLQNPNIQVGLTTSFVLFNGTVNAAGNTELTPIGDANYMDLHWNLDVTAISGTWDIIQQERDPNTGNWADVQTLFSGISAVTPLPGTLYTFSGHLGSVTDLAVRWVPTVAGSITFSLTVTLKDGTGGSASGLARSIFLGDSTVNPNNGYELKEGVEEVIMLGPDLQLFAIALVNTFIKVFVM